MSRTSGRYCALPLRFFFRIFLCPTAGIGHFGTGGLWRLRAGPLSLVRGWIDCGDQFDSDTEDREVKRLLRILASRQASAQAKNSREPKVRSRVRQA